ncbi:hypothetical protein BTHE68_28650 [Burkholderia sp. THE68]|nr:hypothetical protein BTHE68_28650 [Burkholderia sp. THE68]
MTYYVARFQQRNIRRVFNTRNDVRAEAAYADFAKKSMTLADAEISRIKLEAERHMPTGKLPVNRNAPTGCKRTLRLLARSKAR